MRTLVGPPAWAGPGRPTSAHRASTSTASDLRMVPPRNGCSPDTPPQPRRFRSTGRVGDLGGALEAVVPLETQRQLALGPDQRGSRGPRSQLPPGSVVAHDADVVWRRQPQRVSGVDGED